MGVTLDFKTTYRAFKLLYCNPDQDDVLAFLYVYEQIKAGRDISELMEEIENNQGQVGWGYPAEYKLNYQKTHPEEFENE